MAKRLWLQSQDLELAQTQRICSLRPSGAIYMRLRKGPETAIFSLASGTTLGRVSINRARLYRQLQVYVHDPQTQTSPAEG